MTRRRSRFYYSVLNFLNRHFCYYPRLGRRVSVIANLERIQTVGVATFVAEEASKWSCTECGTRLCMHKPKCVNCGRIWNVYGNRI